MVTKSKPKLKANLKHINIHKAAQNAIKHLKKLPPGVRKQMGNLSTAQLNYGSTSFHHKVGLPYQQHNKNELAKKKKNPKYQVRLVKC